MIYSAGQTKKDSCTQKKKIFAEVNKSKLPHSYMLYDLSQIIQSQVYLGGIYIANIKKEI